jgi:hypothetical protein
MEATKLSIAATGNLQGKHALIARATVEADGDVLLSWERYGPGPL